MTYLPERTISYKTYIKRTMRESLDAVFKNHPDEYLKNVKVTIDYPRDQTDYPAVVIKFFERKIYNSGIGHEEYHRVYDPPQPTIEATTGSLPLNRYEYRISYILASGEETEASLPLTTNVDFATGGFTLTWDAVDGVQKYRVYRRARGQRHVYVETTDPTYTDTGFVGTEGSPLNTRHFQRYRWSGDIEFNVYALSTLDRDIIADTLVQTIAMGELNRYTARLFDRVYTSNFELYPLADYNYINLNSDVIVGFGETQAPVPWMAEDEIIYQNGYRVEASGEFFNIPGAALPTIEEVIQYPYVQDIDSLPQGNEPPWPE